MGFFDGLLKGVSKAASGALGGILGGVGSQIIGNILTPKGTNAPKNIGTPQGYDALYPMRQAAGIRAYNALDPSRINPGAMRSRFNQQGAQIGDYNAARLASSGFSQSAQQGARLGATNQATAQGNDYLRGLYDPSQIYQRYAGQAAALDPLFGIGAGIQNQQSNQRYADTLYQQQRPPSLGESFAGILGSTAPYWGDAFNGQIGVSTPIPYQDGVPGFAGGVIPYPKPPVPYQQQSWLDPSLYRQPIKLN